MTDRELLQMALDALDEARDAIAGWGSYASPYFQEKHNLEGDIDDCDAVIEALRAALAQPDQEPVATLFGSLPVYDVPPKQEPVAWRTFDGEGGYEFRSYEMNENYAEEWAQRNPNHKGWVEPLYKDPTPCQTCESLARTVMMDQTSHDTAPPQREWVGLTDEEIDELAEANLDFNWKDGVEDFARAIEAKLKGQNNG